MLKILYLTIVLMTISFLCQFLTYHIATRIRTIWEQHIGGRYSMGLVMRKRGRRVSKEPLLKQPRTALMGVGIWAGIIEWRIMEVDKRYVRSGKSIVRRSSGFFRRRILMHFFCKTWWSARCKLTQWLK